MTPEQAVVAAILLCLGGAVLTLLVSRNKTVAGWLAFVFTAGDGGADRLGGGAGADSGPGAAGDVLGHARSSALPCGSTWTA